MRNDDGGDGGHRTRVRADVVHWGGDEAEGIRGSRNREVVHFVVENYTFGMGVSLWWHTEHRDRRKAKSVPFSGTMTIEPNRRFTVDVDDIDKPDESVATI
jgi:hypothetical protein